MLEEALRGEPRRGELIRNFQDKVWNSDPAPNEEWAWRLLKDLAYDLDYYEPDVTARESESSYFGDERCREHLTFALKELRRGLAERKPSPNPSSGES